MQPHARSHDRVVCPLHELADPGAKGFTLGGGEWPLRGFVVRRGDTVRFLPLAELIAR